MVSLEQDALKEVLKCDFLTNRRSGKYLLLYNIYAEIIEGYPAHQAAQIISKDLGLVIKDYTIRRAKSAAERESLSPTSKQSRKAGTSIKEGQCKKAESKLDDVLNNYRPVGMDENKSSNIVFHNK